ncbi:ribose-phosphate pyrophosphokinase [Candidatus Parcubacteria bacterium]|nr:MAG: ribose-phosphate pyrophosphokinase [Candidatus Parcubacteria bacterium]
MAKSEELVIFCGGGQTNRLALPTIEVVNKLRPGETPLNFSHINFGRYGGDRESDDRFESPSQIEGKHVIFFINTHKAHLVMQVLQFVWSMKNQYNAKSVTVVMPFMGYRRQDHPEKFEEIHRHLWLVQNLKQNGTDFLIMCDPHSEQNIKNCQKVGLAYKVVDPTQVYAAALNQVIMGAKTRGQKILIDTPDWGSLPRAVRLAKATKATLILGAKKRDYTGEVDTNQSLSSAQVEQIESIARENQIEIVYEPTAITNLIQDAIIIMREDELDTGRTASKRGHWLRSCGAAEIHMAVTHMVCSDGWKRQVFDNTPFTTIFGGTTIYRPYENRTGGLVKDVDMSVPIAHILAQVINEL